MELLTLAAQQGSSQAAAFLGAVYLHGNAGVIQDVKKGVKFLEQGIACNERATWAKGIAEGILGQALVEGLIVPKKVNRGVKLLKEACFADDTYAKTVLGALPSRHIWIFKMARDPSGEVVFGLSEIDDAAVDAHVCHRMGHCW